MDNVLADGKSIFGEPGTGVHETSPRYRTDIYFSIFNFKNYWDILFWTFIVGELFHVRSRVINFLEDLT
jgi:hypothetical protein